VKETLDSAEDSRKIQSVLAEMKDLEGRDTQLWSIGALLLLVTIAGVVAVLVPIGQSVELEYRFLLVALYGLISLLVLYNVYVLRQKKSLRLARADLVRQLMRAEAAEQQAMSDPLTGLFNRRYLEFAMAAEVKRVARSGNSLSLLMFDLDDFGDVNKRRGYLEGDRILCEFAQVLRAVFRQTDTVARLGGDEFVAVLPDAAIEQARMAESRLLSAVSLHNRGEEDPDRRIHVSTGLAEFNGDEAIEETLKRADGALRDAKAAKPIGAES
jgi:diguanylate cyclase (GGDEF)-like protein